MAQTIVTISILVLIGVSAYLWRHKALQSQVNSSETSSISNTTTSQVENTSPLGDMSIFIKIAQDTRDLVVVGDLSGAKTRVADLEHEWDDAEARLKPMNKTKWTEVDDALDKVFRQLRAVSPTTEGSKSALDALLVVLK